jgi:hypothetical protein
MPKNECAELIIVARLQTAKDALGLVSTGPSVASCDAMISASKAPKRPADVDPGRGSSILLLTRQRPHAHMCRCHRQSQGKI